MLVINLCRAVLVYIVIKLVSCDFLSLSSQCRNVYKEWIIVVNIKKMAVKNKEKSVSKSKVSKKVVVVLLILAALLITASVAIITSNNSAKVIAENNKDNNANVNVIPAVESAKVSLIINPNPNTPK